MKIKNKILCKQREQIIKNQKEKDKKEFKFDMDTKKIFVGIFTQEELERYAQAKNQKIDL